MDQKAENNSVAVQAKRDIHIHGMQYTEVKNLCMDLIVANFPKLQQEAMDKVNQNVIALANEIKSELDKKISDIDLKKLSDPDVQAALNEAVQGAGKKGTKTDLNLLAKLVTSRLDTNNTDLLDITIEEAVRIAPKLTSEHINFLSIKHFMSRIKWTNPDVNFQIIEHLAQVVDQNIPVTKLSSSNFSYLSGLGLLEYSSILTHDIYTILHSHYKGLEPDLEKFKEQLQNHSPTMDKLAKLYVELECPRITLHSCGVAIALTNLSRFFPIDLKIWIY